MALHQLGVVGFERLGNLRVELLASAAQQASMGGVLHQRMLENVNRVRGCSALKHQLGGDEASEGGLQLVLRKLRQNAQ